MFFRSLMKCILSMVINITSPLLMGNRDGLRAPACDHFYFRNLNRSAYMNKFTESVNSEAMGERNTQFTSVQPYSSLELSLIYTQGIGGRSRIHCVEVLRMHEICSTPPLTLQPTKQHRANSAPSAPAFQSKTESASLFRTWEYS